MKNGLKMKHILLLLLLIFLIDLGAIGQNVNPGEDEIYRESEVAIIHLVMSAEDKAFLLAEENIDSDVYLSTTFRFTNSVIDETIPNQIGIKLRGNTSRGKPKRSFKLKFKEFGGEKFYDQKKFNLKAEVNDPSLVRELTTLQTYRKRDVPAARSHHAEVYLNEEYMGVYLNVEQIDDEFIASRFDDKAGNLYKCTWGATLENNGQIYNNGTYELKTNTAVDNRAILDNFVKVLNTTSSANFEEAIEAVFNVNKFIKYLAVEALTGHWDGYSYNQNNFYLYENMTTGLIEFIPYDVDNTFGIDWVSRDWGTRDVLDWASHGGARPLTKKVLARDKYFQAYRRALNAMLKEDFSASYFNSYFDDMKAMLSDPVSRDEYFPLSFGYSFSDFQNSFTQEVTGHAPYGLKDYVSVRAEYAINQIGEVITSIDDAEGSYFEFYPNPSNGTSGIIQTNEKIESISLVDIWGKSSDFTIQPGNNFEYQLFFDLSTGIYFLHINEHVKKILVTGE
jgi:spore coat protein CotH